MGDPMGRTLIERAVQNSQPATVLEDELIEVIGNMPMSTLANFGGMSLDHDASTRSPPTGSNSKPPRSPDCSGSRSQPASFAQNCPQQLTQDARRSCSTNCGFEPFQTPK